MREKPSFNHIAESGGIRMADVSAKPITARWARAEAVVRLGPAVAAMLGSELRSAKGPVLETARLAGILAAKRTAELIPLCHPIPLDVVRVEAVLEGDTVRIVSSVRCRHTTGVEMEALTAAAVAALTVYDMCKSAGKGMEIVSVRLLEKKGGQSGDWRRKEADSR